MTDTVTIENERWRIGFLPQMGGSLAFGQVRIDGEWVDVLRPTPDDVEITNHTASYPLVPWSNRIRNGLLRFSGREYQLRPNWPDGTAIHGAAWEFPWAVADRSETHITLEFSSTGLYGVNWPWEFTARFTYALDGDDFTWTYSVTNDAHETFPAGFGHHPYLLRSVAGSADPHLQVNVEKAYDLEECMATGPAGEIRPAADFRESREIGQTFVDDCFTGRTGEDLATITWPDTLTLNFTADAALEHAVLYIPPGRDYFAFEPVSNANDAFNLDEDGVAGAGLFLLQPGETRTASFTIAATPQR
ncbi:hypothetical protein [Demequina flava]|uniref:aldose epimerase family protein n=1 Tax=Demequina flava TaxID=1095025 RepID=UPI0007806094|nr:hypothetical protein [Demequina flava]